MSCPEKCATCEHVRWGDTQYPGCAHPAVSRLIYKYHEKRRELMPLYSVSGALTETPANCPVEHMERRVRFSRKWGGMVATGGKAR